MNERTPHRVMVVDDEPPAVERMVDLLGAEPAFRVVACESRADRVIERCRKLQPDLLLMDIEMPGFDGIELAHALRSLDPSPALIFVTAHDEYAVDAFDLAALDYLVKPVRAERLHAALMRFDARVRTDRSGATPPPMLAGRIGDRRLRIPIDDVRALTSEDKCTVVHSSQGRALSDASLKELEERYGDHLMRVHRATLVNRRHIRSLFRDADGVERLTLAGLDLEPEVSRRNHAAVKRLLTGQSEP
jgi:two-component system response regulator AlgR